MKLGLSTYSLQNAIDSKEMTVPDVIRWAAGIGAEHVEIVPLGYSIVDNQKLLEEILGAVQETGIEISNYAVGANFAKADDEEYESEIQAVLRHVDAARALRVKRMRHDAATRPIAETSADRFDADLPRLADACRRIADYAAPFGIVTSVENHGFYCQASERVQRLIHAVGRDNFKTTLDVGNFLCVDEDPVSAVMNNAPYASMVHLKDFYVRPSDRNPGEGWFRSTHGNYLRGAIVGQGNIDLPRIIRILKESGYDGYVSVEFEGLEECRTGSRIALDNARRLWAEA